MTRTFVSFPINNIDACKKQLLTWAARFKELCFLDNNNYHFNYNSYECILAAGISSQVQTNSGNAFNELKQFALKQDDWMFGHLGYDLKNELEELSSSHSDGIGFPDLFFFVPRVVILLNNHEMSIGCLQDLIPQNIYNEISSTTPDELRKEPPVTVRSRFSREEYMATVKKLQSHILKGDCYEINFCQEFYADNIDVNPLQIYFALAAISANPFAAFYKLDNKYLCCASPERYLKKQGNKIVAQPIKGTSSRDLQNSKSDLLNKTILFESSKDRSENVMIVDLVRNDLSRISEEGTVMVEELYGIYSYPQVHQMISTVSGLLKTDLDWVDAVRSCFPVGSMTGAPKKRVMELIERYEKSKRGLFSGAVGYINPEGNFDFNVVIRSIFINQEKRYLSYQVGSAITFNSDPEKEYEECLLKAAAIRAVLT